MMTETDKTVPVPAELTEEFLFGGRARFRLANPISGASFMIEVRKPRPTRRRPNPDVFFATTEDGRYLGRISESDRTTLDAGYRGDSSAPEFAALAWLLRNVDDHAPARLEHLGHCAACGRSLTDETSVATGFGPKCSKRLGITRVAPEPVELPVAADQAQAIEIARTGERPVAFPFRTIEQAETFIHEHTLEGDLTVGEAIEMYQHERAGGGVAA